MDSRVEKVRQVREQPVDDVAPQQEVREVTSTHTDDSPASSALAARIISYLLGVLLVLLGFRFVLALLGANPSNGFANFVYSASHPFVAPFFSLFGYDLRYGVTRFELFTLVAMAVYSIVAFGLIKLVTLNRPR